MPFVILPVFGGSEFELCFTWLSKMCFLWQESMNEIYSSRACFSRDFVKVLKHLQMSFNKC